MLLEVLRRETPVFERQKVITTTKTTTKEVESKDVRLSESTTAQQPQNIPEGEIVISKGKEWRICWTSNKR